VKAQVVATHDCRHRPDLERELEDLGIPYELVFVEDRPQLVRQLGIRHSPNLIVNDRVVFRGQPSKSELRAYFLARR
jgi:glutaredoxin